MDMLHDRHQSQIGEKFLWNAQAVLLHTGGVVSAISVLAGKKNPEKKIVQLTLTETSCWDKEERQGKWNFHLLQAAPPLRLCVSFFLLLCIHTTHTQIYTRQKHFSEPVSASAAEKQMNLTSGLWCKDGAVISSNPLYKAFRVIHIFPVSFYKVHWLLK